MSSPPRKTLKLKTAAPARDPRRRPVRPGAAPPAAAAGAKGGPAGPSEAAKAGTDRPRRAAKPFGEAGERPSSRTGPKTGAKTPPFGAKSEAPKRPRPATGAKPERSAAPGPATQRPRAPAPSHTRPGTPPVPAPRARPAVPPSMPERSSPPGAAPSPPSLQADRSAEGVRLSKHLADQGLASRREADEWIEAGWVRVDGRVAVLGQRVLPHQHVEIDPAAHRAQAQRMTILLNKPIGYVSGQAEDGYEPASVLVTPENHWSADGSRISFHPGHVRGLAPAGRLDIDSTGLLVLTQDGRIAKLLIGEDSRVEKEYLVRVEPMAEGSVKPDALALLNHGLWLDGQELKPAKVSWQNEQQLRFVLREGRKRQIRRMCELVGYKVTALKRVRIGSIALGPLPLGQWRYLGPHEKFI